MTNDFNQLTINTLAQFKNFGIKSRTVIKMYNQTCRMLKEYLEENDLEFSLESGQKWLLEIRPKEPLTHVQYVKYSSRRRTVFMLAECKESRLKTWRIYWRKTPARPTTSEYLKLLQIYEEKLRADGMAKATVDFAMRVNSDFLIYLETTGKFVINEVLSQDVVGYFRQDSFFERKPEGVKAYAYKLKLFLTFLEDTGIVCDKKLSLVVPKVFSRQESIVTVLSPKAISVLRNKSDNPDVGAAIRDHAMILLALRLGIRQSDIIKMKLGDINWKNDSMSFIQRKTGIPITLPLLPDVGNALMDYILNYRPQSPNDIIFLRHYAPHMPLSSCRGIAVKYLSGLGSEDCPQQGFHIMRRTFATLMLRNNIPRSVISASIGQVDPNSVDVYLSADEENMRKCAISLKRIECTKGDLL